MRRRREYPLAVIFGLFVMGLAAAGVGAALLLAPPTGYAPNETPTPRPTPTQFSEEFPSFTAEPTIEPTAEPTEEPTAEPTEEPTAEPTEAPTAEPTVEPTAEPTSSDIYAARRDALDQCSDRDNCGVHVAEQGDWLSRLAIFYGVELEAIEAFNPEIDDPNRIAVGELIRIPR